MKRESQKLWCLKRDPVGPLVSYLDLFAIRLAKQGFCRRYISSQIRFCADFSRWLQSKNIRAKAVTVDRVEEYIKMGDHRKTVHQGKAAYSGPN